MKTPEEIKKGLECCSLTDVAEIAKYAKRGIPYACVEDLIADALALIQQLEKELELERSVKKATLVFTSGSDITWEIERMPRWISVEERLPPEGQPVIVFATHTDRWSGHWHAVMEDCWFGGGWDVNCDTDIHKVTHWMPLPEPPVEE